MASMTPQPSCPSPPGSVGNFIQSGPAQGVRFEAQTPHPSSRRRTWPGPGSGNRCCSTCITPGPVTTAACICWSAMATFMISPSVAIDELVEAALAAIGRLVLVEEGKLVLVEDLEELVPGDFLEIVLGLSEVDPQDAALTLGIHHGRMTVAGFGPFADFVVVGRRVRTAQRNLQIGRAHV